MRRQKWTTDLIRSLISENNIEKSVDLMRLDSSAYSFVVRNDLYDELGLKRRRVIKREKVPHKEYELDITKVLHYLKRWAYEEGTTVRHQADIMGYGKEYVEYVKKFGEVEPEDINTIKKEYEKRDVAL